MLPQHPCHPFYRPGHSRHNVHSFCDPCPSSWPNSPSHQPGFPNTAIRPAPCCAGVKHRITILKPLHFTPTIPTNLPPPSPQNLAVLPQQRFQHNAVLGFRGQQDITKLTNTSFTPTVPTSPHHPAPLSPSSLPASRSKRAIPPNKELLE
jgi:hypothetical protein